MYTINFFIFYIIFDIIFEVNLIKLTLVVSKTGDIMDLKIYEYIIAIEEFGNISKAASSLFITPSALNQQLKKLEDSIGTKLFTRDKHNLKITEAGKLFLDSARAILRIQNRTDAMIQDLKNNCLGEISLGLTHEHGIDIFSDIFPKFNKVYPGINFKLTESVVSKQYGMIKNGEIQLAIVMQKKDSIKNFRRIKIYDESMILGIPRTEHYSRYITNPPGYPIQKTDLKNFANETFSLMFKGSTMREVIDVAFENSGFVPNILIETAMNHALIKLVSSGLSCTIIPESRALPYINDDKIAWFHISNELKWEVSFVMRKDTYLTDAQKYFIELAIEYAKKLKKRFL